MDKKIKEFRFTADITFYADGIDDAFNLLGKHFTTLTQEDEEGGTKDSDFDFIGEIHIEPADGTSRPYYSHNNRRSESEE